MENTSETTEAEKAEAAVAAAAEEPVEKEAATVAVPEEPVEKEAEAEKVTESPKPEKPQKRSQEEPTGGVDMSMLEHLTELRKRIIYSIFAVLVGTAIAYNFLDDIMLWLIEPAGKLYYMQPAEAFFVYVKVTLFSGFILALPVIFYEAWAFLLPALTMRERLILSILVPFSVVLFVGGILFSFKLVLPIAMTFFLGMGGADFQPFLSAGSYFDFVLTFVLPFGLLFELPLIMMVLAWMGLITSEMLAAKFRIVILVCFVIGALLTPPDVISQTMMAVPMIMLYGVGYVGVKYILRK